MVCETAESALQDGLVLETKLPALVLADASDDLQVEEPYYRGLNNYLYYFGGVLIIITQNPIF